MQNGTKMEKEPITIEGLEKLKIELIFLKEKNSLKKFGLERYSFKLENSGSRIINNF